MDLDQLQSVRDRERQTDDLQELRESFYADAGAFVSELREERAEAAEAADDPFDSPRVNRLTDRIRTAERTLEAIYEKRVGKVVTAATFAAADLPADMDGMTAEEADLFETLVAEIQANREQALGSVAADEDDDLAPPETSEDADVPAADAMGQGTAEQRAPPEPPAPAESTDAEEPEPPAQDAGESVERELVRITDDVGAILGVDDREYDLSTDDVVTLPAANARPLIERGVAEPVDRQGGGR